MNAEALAGPALPLAAAAAAGALIGLEREFRGHPAGLRTHTLVCLVSALLLAVATHPPAGVVGFDPGRVAQGLLTGIGFLCGGVIVRQGLSVHGITTAASLWVVSALGALFGVGALGLATAGALAALTVLVAFRWIDERLPETFVLDVSVAYRREGPFPEAEFRALLAELDLHPRALRQRLVSSGEAIEFGATLRGPSGAQTNRLARRLCDDPRVLRFHIEPATGEP
ncbi:MAG TPA: MgtC/SapB family protein [Phenylobacterium sp.]|nr:MgtC/SapB family protein [Phenylobacterium sp.]